MGIKQTTPMSEIDRQIEAAIENQRKQFIKHLQVIGEKVVNEAREKGSYKDQTGNLRSSIGYIVVVDGRVIEGRGASFQVVKDGHQGAKEGREYISQLAADYPTGIALIVVAGKKYAKFVQALGFDVTISAEHLASRLLLELGMPNIKRIE